MDKTAQLQTVLGRLAPQQAVQLAHAVELDHALGKEKLPSAPILEALRPTLRLAKPPRVPTLQRLICAGLEEFLCDRADDPRLEGLIPRSSLAPWWQAVTLIAAGEIQTFETKLREQLTAPVPHLEALQHEVQSAAIGWSTTLVAEMAKTKPDAAIRKLLREPIARDVDVIAHVLNVAQPLTAAMKTLTRVAARVNVLEEKRITDLTTDCVTLVKQQYLALSESHGMDARFLALAVLNRLTQSVQVLRLGRALSWKPNDSLVANTELFCIGARLIGEVERLARALLLQMPQRGPLPSGAMLGAALAHYLDESEGVLTEIGVRRDSPWGASILQTRSHIAEALNSDFLDRFADQILAVMPMTDRRKPDLAEAPTRETIIAANDAAGFLRLLTQRGQRHGFAKPAYETLDELGPELEARISALCEIAARSPADGPVIEAQVRAMADICDELFNDGRSTVFMRRLTAALHVPAA
jgi:hypothetical protein